MFDLLPKRLVPVETLDRQRNRCRSVHWELARWLVLALICLSNNQFAKAQEKLTLTREQWETGFHAFSQIMRKRGIELESSFETWQESPVAERILILMGRVTPEDQFYLDQFVMRGGSALLATDVDCGPLRVDRHQIRISDGGRVRAAIAEDRFARTDGWPIVSQLNDEESLFAGVERLIPNFPAILETRPRLDQATGWQTIARYPPLIYHGRNRPFIVRFVGGRGERLLLVPDHSLYVNGAVSAGDNLRFMLNTVDWLREGGRTRCLFVLNGAVITPANVSGVELYRAPPGSAETRRALEELWRRTTTAQKLELANDALEVVQEERLLEEIVDAIRPEEMISPNRWLAVLLVVGTWCVIITFVVLLVSNRKQPLEGNSTDGLKLDDRQEIRRRQQLERSRAAEAMFVHFMNRVGGAITRPGQLDIGRLQIDMEAARAKRLRKDIQRVRDDLVQQPIDFWTEARLKQIGRYIAQWADLSETGALRWENSAPDREPGNLRHA